MNAFTVRVADQAGLYAEATLNILVNNAMPAGWASSDIGTTGIAGSSGESHSSPGTFTISGSGADIWNNADAFQYASQTLVGDGEIIARVTSITNTDPWAKAGVMIRDGSSVGAPNVMMTTTAVNGFGFQWRDTLNAGSNYTYGSATNAVPKNWVRLVRVGNVFTGYSSANGTIWTQVGTATVTMNSSVLVGLAVSSHANTALNTATYDTDGSIVARVSSLQNTGNSARVGVMIRDTLANNSRMASATVTMAGNCYIGLAVASGSTTTLNTSVINNVTVVP